jgi:type I restriction enzyme M protein
MVKGTLKNDINKLWEEFWTGGITNPIAVIEQISYLMFARLLDINEQRNEKKALHSSKNVKLLFSKKQQHLRWKNFKHAEPEDMLKLVRNEVFPHFKELAPEGAALRTFMADAQLLIQKPTLLVSAVNMIDNLPLEREDIKGDLYEYLLSKLTTAGIAGQFRTPRHIINMMVELVDPKINDVIADPACGTAGFLVSCLHYLQEKYTSKDGQIEHDGQIVYTMDKLSPAEKKLLQNEIFYGFDFDVTMLRISAMNMILHGIENPNIYSQDTLSNSFMEKRPQLAADKYTLIMANPPFKGSLDFESVHSSLLKKVKTKKTELLFIVLMLRMLKLGGRCAVIVPDGVLFGSSTAHRDLRQMLINENQLEAVISMPSGVFRPYAGVSTAVLVFAKGGKTDNVFYYDMEVDGFSLDDKRDEVPENDIPDILTQWKKWKTGKAAKSFEDRKQKAFFVPAKEITEQNYDLSIGRYKEHVYEEVQYDPPKKILGRLNELEVDIQNDLAKLEGMLG